MDNLAVMASSYLTKHKQKTQNKHLYLTAMELREKVFCFSLDETPAASPFFQSLCKAKLKHPVKSRSLCFKCFCLGLFLYVDHARAGGVSVQSHEMLTF